MLRARLITAGPPPQQILVVHVGNKFLWLSLTQGEAKIFILISILIFKALNC